MLRWCRLEKNRQSGKTDANSVGFYIYVVGCLLCSFFGAVIGWIIRDMLIR